VGGAVTLGQTPFGLLGVRMAKSIGVADGGGRILNSEGGVNEVGCFRKAARWVDYSGPVTADVDEGILCWTIRRTCTTQWSFTCETTVGWGLQQRSVCPSR
jgi:hypothetical protein